MMEVSDWFDEAAATEAVRLDVRPLLASGQEPFAAILSTAATVPEGGFMLLDAPFDPAPLRRVLAGKGFSSQGRKLAEGHWRICFRRNGIADPPGPLARRTGESWMEEDGLHVDVRGLQPPEPMTLILGLIDRRAADRILVHHEREPMFLYPELGERGWVCRSVRELPGEVRLVLEKEEG